MKDLLVATGKPYHIKMERGLLRHAGEEIRAVSAARRVVVVSDSNVAPLYADAVLSSLQAAGFEPMLFTFPAGEASKRFAVVEEMITAFLQHGLTRSDLTVALGGGVCGDMVGFASAIYLRGIDFVQIPTSLLAQIDSSVGGKTGVDLPAGKNLIGAFWQPRLVLIDPDTLDTLPEHYFSDGMAEAIKYGCIKDRSLFEKISQEDAHTFLEELIFRCVDIKRQVVENDEREHGERILLNFGHTLGHALEKATGYQTVSHGEAVGIGMVLVAAAAEHAGITKPGSTKAIAEVLQKYRLPISTTVPLSTLCAGATVDKKAQTDGVKLVLLREIGEAFAQKVTFEELLPFLQQGNEVVR